MTRGDFSWHPNYHAQIPALKLQHSNYMEPSVKPLLLTQQILIVNPMAKPTGNVVNPTFTEC